MFEPEGIMSVIVDRQFEENVSDVFGKYRGTLETGNVRVDLFERDGEMFAYIAREGRGSTAQAVEPYLDVLSDYATQNGLKLRLVFTT